MAFSHAQIERLRCIRNKWVQRTRGITKAPAHVSSSKTRSCSPHCTQLAQITNSSHVLMAPFQVRPTRHPIRRFSKHSEYFISFQLQAARNYFYFPNRQIYAAESLTFLPLNPMKLIALLIRRLFTQRTPTKKTTVAGTMANDEEGAGKPLNEQVVTAAAEPEPPGSPKVPEPEITKSNAHIGDAAIQHIPLDADSGPLKRGRRPKTKYYDTISANARVDALMNSFDEVSLTPDKIVRLKQLAASIIIEPWRVNGIRALLYTITTPLSRIGYSAYHLAKLTEHENWPRDFIPLKADRIDGFARFFHTSEEVEFFASTLLLISILHVSDHTCFKFYLTQAAFEAADSVNRFEDVLRLAPPPKNTTVGNEDSIYGEKVGRIRARAESLFRFLDLPSPPDISGFLKSTLFSGLKPTEDDSQIGQFSLISIRPNYQGDSFRAFELKFTLVETLDGAGQILYVRTYSADSQSPENYIADGIVIQLNTLVYFLQYQTGNGGLLISAIPVGQFQANGLHVRKGLALSIDMAGNQETLASPVIFYRPASSPGAGDFARLIGAVSEPAFNKIFDEPDQLPVDKTISFLRNYGEKIIITPQTDETNRSEMLFTWGELKDYIDKISTMPEFTSIKRNRIAGISGNPMRIL